MNLFNYLIHRIVQQLCHGYNKAKKVRHNATITKIVVWKMKSETTQKRTSKRPFMWSRIGVEKLGVDTHAILQTYKSKQSGQHRALEICY